MSFGWTAAIVPLKSEPEIENWLAEGSGPGELVANPGRCCYADEDVRWAADLGNGGVVVERRRAEEGAGFCGVYGESWRKVGRGLLASLPWKLRILFIAMGDERRREEGRRRGGRET